MSPLLMLVLVAAIAMGAFLYSQSKSRPTTVGLPEITNNLSSQKKIEPTPIPFVEMTVPYQKDKQYESTLGEQIKLSENSSYTSYTTSYRSDGLKVNGLLTIPKGTMPENGWPAIVFVHGYIPPTLYQTTKNYGSYVDALAKQGFVVFKIDLRGHDASEGEAGGAYYSADYVSDTLHARAALQNSRFVDKRFVGLWGHSMAGNILMRSVVAKPEIPAVVIWAGAVYSYTDLQKYGIDDNSYRPPTDNTERMRKRQLLREAHGDFSEQSDFWKQVAATNYLADIKGAVQIHHAIDDTVVNIGYSRDLIRLLTTAGIRSELHEYQSGGHNINGSNFTAAMNKTVQFFKQHLSP